MKFYTFLAWNFTHLRHFFEQNNYICYYNQL